MWAEIDSEEYVDMGWKDKGNIQDIEDIRKRAARCGRRDSGQDEAVKRQAGEDMVILLQNWKQRLRRYRIYRFFLGLSLAASCTALVAMLYYQIDSSIPVFYRGHPHTP